MNILVTGANGQLGQCIRDVVEVNGNGTKDHYVGEKNHYIFKSRRELDILECEKVLKFVKENFINVIVNCAAYTDVNAAQEYRDAAKLVNGVAVENLALAAKAVGAVLIHISTDYVFSAKSKRNTPIEPVDVYDFSSFSVSPEDNFYGYSKLLGERLIKKIGCKHIIIRTSWLYSWYGDNFVKKMYKKICNGDDIKVVYDQVGSPTSAHELARFIYHIIEGHNQNTRYLCKEGIYNFAENGVASWYDIVQQIRIILETEGCELSANKIKPCLSSEFKQPVVRPNYSVLDNSKTVETFDYDIQYWADRLCHVVYHLFYEDLDKINEKSIEKIESSINKIEDEIKKLRENHV